MLKLFLKAVDAVNPTKLLAENFKIEKGNLHVCDKVYTITNKNGYVVGFGKAVLGMASQCEKILGSYLKRGVISAPYNIQNTFKNNLDYCLKPNSKIEVHEGAKNNLPDSDAEKAADEIIKLIKTLNPDDFLVVLISGGGSALLPKPKPGITLAEKLQTINSLVSSGADINELNIIRKKLSMVKGGGLGHLSYPVQTICLIISDVMGDPIDIIASGPTTPNTSTDSSAVAILQKYNLENKLPKGVLDQITIPSKKYELPHVDNFIIGTNQKALNAAKALGVELNFSAIIVSNLIRGNVQTVSDYYINLIFSILNSIHGSGVLNESLFKDDCIQVDIQVLKEISDAITNLNNQKPICLLCGGETTVEVKGTGKGGRNQELVLLLSMKLYDLKMKYSHLFEKHEVTFLCAGTDGIDGPTDAAGAIGGLTLVEKAKQLNLNINEFLSGNDSYNFFNKIDDGSYFIKTGHTGTNVMDIHIITIQEKQSPG